MRTWAVAFLSGILFVQQFSSLPALNGLWLCLPIALLFFAHRYLISSFVFPMIVISGVGAGFSWAMLHAQTTLGHQLLAQYEGIDLVIEGQVSSLPELRRSDLQGTRQTGYRPNSLRFNFRVDRVINLANIDPDYFPKQLRLSWYGAAERVKAGELWRLKVRLKRPYGFMNPGGFDYESWLYQQRIQAKGYVKKSTDNHKVIARTSSSFIAEKSLTFRQFILDKLLISQPLLGKSSEIIDLAAALILGHRAGLDTVQWQVFQRTGTIHLMAISGLHIGLIAGLVFFLAGYLWRFTGRGCLLIPAPQVAAAGALIAAFIYALLAGFTIPTQRALIMLLVAMIHILVKRTPLPASKTIALALILVLLFDPLAVLAQGFWLSFMAVSLIIYFISRTNVNRSIELNLLSNNKNNQRTRALLSRLKANLLQFTRLQLGLTVFMFPLVLYFYQSSSLVSPIANFVAIPVMSLIVVPLLFLSTFILLVSIELANSLFQLVSYIYETLWIFLTMLSNWKYATFDVAIDSLWLLLSCYLVIFGMLLVRTKAVRWFLPVLMLPFIAYSSPSLNKGKAVVTILDVGQGLATVIQTSKHTVVFDTGPRYSKDFDTGRAVIVPYLRQMHRDQLDTLIISHGDNDHIGGLESIKTLLPIQRILTSVPNEVSATKDTAIIACQSGFQWNYDGVVFSILSPAEITESKNGHDENNQSCVLKVATKYGSVLLTGDIERETESQLYHSIPEQLRSDILVVPHHGSRTSSLVRFIQSVSPKYVVFPAGYRNRYRLPAKKVVQRYREHTQAKLYKTSQTGALSFYFDMSGRKPEQFRQAARRYWHTHSKLPL